MSKNNKPINNHKKKASSTKILLICIPAVILLGVFGFWFNYYLVQRATLEELSNVSRDVQLIYGSIIKANGDNVETSYFRHECSEASVEIGRGQIVCATVGTVILKQGQKLEIAGQVLEDTVRENALDAEKQAQVNNDQYYSAASLEYTSPYKGVTCSGHYAQSSSSKKWAYTIGCRKIVSDFLPGYAIEK